MHFALTGVELTIRSTNHLFLGLRTFQTPLAILRGLAVRIGSLDDFLAASPSLHFALRSARMARIALL